MSLFGITYSLTLILEILLNLNQVPWSPFQTIFFEEIRIFCRIPIPVWLTTKIKLSKSAFLTAQARFISTWDMWQYEIPVLHLCQVKSVAFCNHIHQHRHLFRILRLYQVFLLSLFFYVTFPYLSVQKFSQLNFPFTTNGIAGRTRRLEFLLRWVVSYF